MATSLLLRSQNRTSASTNSANCQIALSNPFVLNGKTKIAMQSFQILNNMNNITSSNCNVDFKENGIDKTCAIPVGVYAGGTLATALATALTTASGGHNTYTVAWSATTNLLTFSASNAFTLKFLTGTNTATSAWRECGFQASTGLTPVDSSTGTSVVAPYPVNVSNPMSFLMYITELGSKLQTSDSTYPTFYFPITSPANGLLQNTIQNYYQEADVPSGTTSFNRFTFRITDSSGNAVNLQGTDWELFLKCV